MRENRQPFTLELPIISSLKPCPFCDSKIKAYTSVFGIIQFKCTNPKCGAIISFDNDECNNAVNKEINAAKVYNRRAYISVEQGG